MVLLGENGNGKTTLVKLMLGELRPVEGEVLIKSGCRVALVNQHHADQIDLDLTPLEYMMKLFKVRAWGARVCVRMRARGVPVQSSRGRGRLPF